jgi:hypothetical protein
MVRCNAYREDPAATAHEGVLEEAPGTAGTASYAPSADAGEDFDSPVLAPGMTPATMMMELASRRLRAYQDYEALLQQEENAETELFRRMMALGGTLQHYPGSFHAPVQLPEDIVSLSNRRMQLFVRRVAALRCSERFSRELDALYHAHGRGCLYDQLVAMAASAPEAPSEIPTVFRVDPEAPASIGKTLAETMESCFQTWSCSTCPDVVVKILEEVAWWSLYDMVFRAGVLVHAKAPSTPAEDIESVNTTGLVQTWGPHVRNRVIVHKPLGDIVLASRVARQRYASVAWTGPELDLSCDETQYVTLQAHCSSPPGVRRPIPVAGATTKDPAVMAEIIRSVDRFWEQALGVILPDPVKEIVGVIRSIARAALE